VSRSTRRLTSARSSIAGVLLVGVSVSGCAAGFNATTSKPFAPSNGSVASVGDLRIRNVVIVEADDGSTTELYTAMINIGGEADGNGTVAGSSFEAPTDHLTSVTIVGAPSVALPAGPVAVPPNSRVDLGPDGTQVFLTGFKPPVGHVATVTFRFAIAGTVSVSALVMTKTGLVSGG
jgi:hypothetical protein